MKSASYLIMLTVASATGTYLFTAETDRPATGVQAGATQTSATAQPEAAEDPPAQEQAAQATTTDDTAAAASEDEAASKSEADETADEAAKKGSAAKGSPQRFIPSEQVRADFDVSFPVDI